MNADEIKAIQDEVRKWNCTNCPNGIGNGETLHVHHKKYIFGREPWEYDDDNFLTLCENCHNRGHGKIYERVTSKDAELLTMDHIGINKWNINHVEAAMLPQVMKLIVDGSDFEVVYSFINDYSDSELLDEMWGEYNCWDDLHNLYATHLKFEALSKCGGMIGSENYKLNYEKERIAAYDTIPWDNFVSQTVKHDFQRLITLAIQKITTAIFAKARETKDEILQMTLLRQSLTLKRVCLKRHIEAT